MPVNAGRTRAQLRLSIGNLLGALQEHTTSSAGAAGGTTLVDDGLRGGNDAHSGKWGIPNSGALAGVIRQVSDYVATTTTLTVAPAFASQVATAVTYELWDEKYPPSRIHDLMNQAILELYGLAFDPVESVALHGDGRQYRFDIPSGISMINRVEYRKTFESVMVHACERVWDEKTDADFTISVDTEDYKAGSSALKIVVVGAASAGDSISDSITALDISAYTHLEFWIKSTVATAAGDLQLLLDNTASVASPLETLDVPALTANVWTYVRVALANPALDTAVISVGLKYTVDIGAASIRLDEIQATHQDNAAWGLVHPYHWRIDKEGRDLVLDRSGVLQVGTSLIKLSGGDEPTLLTAEGTVNEVDDSYVINKTVGLALLSQLDAESRNRASTFLTLAERAKNGIGVLMNVRHVE